LEAAKDILYVGISRNGREIPLVTLQCQWVFFDTYERSKAGSDKSTRKQAGAGEKVNERTHNYPPKKLTNSERVRLTSSLRF
jgi:hypothetical protein